MTNEEMIQDFKQFIETTISQQTAQLEQRIDGIDTDIKGIREDVAGLAIRLDKVETRLDGLDEKLDLIQDAIADTITQVDKRIDTAIEGHEVRYHGQLKHHAA